MKTKYDLARGKELKSWPLTHRQLSIWTGSVLAAEIPASNMVMTFAIDGRIDVDRFQNAFSVMLDKTDILRTTFVTMNDGVPVQKVNTSFDFHVEFVDFSQSIDPDIKIEQWISNAAIQAFDLTSLCFSSALLKKSENHFIWYLCQHHLITDGLSTQIVYDRVREAYENSNDKSASAIHTYKEYLEQVEKYLASDAYNRDKKYWQEKLQTPVEPLHLYGKSRNFSSRTNRVSITLGEQRSHALKTLSKEMMAISVDMAMFSIFTTILYAYLHLTSGNKRLGLGVPMHNRSPKFKKTAGLMMEVCPLIIEFDEDETFDSLIDKVSQESFDSFRSSKYCTQNSAHARIYDVSMNFLNPVFENFNGTKTVSTYETGLQRMPEKSSSESSWVAGESLTVIINDFSDEDNYLLYFDFNTGIFNDAIQQLAVGHFLKLLDAFITSRSIQLQKISLLTEQERQHLLIDLNKTQILGERASVIQMLEQHAHDQPQKLAAVYGDANLSYEELNQRSNRLAYYLRAVGVGPEVTVGIYMERSLEMLIALLATMKGGGAYIPLDPHHPSDRIEIILEDAKPHILLVDSMLVKPLKVDSKTTLVAFDEIWGQAETMENLDLDLDENRLAYTIFTSGSTGRPKGVQITHMALTNFLHSMAKKPGMTASDRLLSVTTISFDIAALEMYLPILTGGTVEIADQDSTLDPSKLRAKLKNATIFQATPTTFRMLIQDGWQGDKKLLVMCGGEAFPRDLANQLIERANSVWNMYGPTETTIWSTVDKIEAGNIVPIGKPIDNTQVYVLNSKLVPVPQGCIGELYIAGSGLARGYHQRPDLTAAVFISNPFTKDKSAQMYRTGDLARLLPNDKLECLGRVDFQVKIRGFRIELGEIETLLGQHPDVEQNVVVVKEQGDQKNLVGYVALNRPVDVSKLRDHLRDKLPLYMVPSIIVILEKLPLTPNGKVDRKQLPMPVEDDISSCANYIGPNSEIEKKIALVWGNALGMNRVSTLDNFFDIGGHSLLALEVLHAINKSCNAKLSLSAIFETPTIQELAILVDSKLEENKNNGATVTLLKKGNKGIPVFCICGIYLYQSLAQQIQTDNSVYGVFLPQETEMWMNSTKDKLPTVQELAYYYIKAIKQIQPQGPYCLAGISFGGVLAYEMVQQLEANGESIKTLAILDAILPRAIKKRIHLLVKHYARQVRSLGIKYLIKVFSRRFVQLPIISKLYRKNVVVVNNVNKITHDDMIAYRRQTYTKAIALYDKEIKPYSGSALLFCSEQSHNAFAGYEVMDCRGWSTIIDYFDIHVIKGDHMGILQEPNVKDIAAVLEKNIS